MARLRRPSKISRQGNNIVACPCFHFIGMSLIESCLGCFSIMLPFVPVYTHVFASIGPGI